MAKECGPSAAQDKLNETIASAKGEVDNLIGDSLGGLADSNVPLKDKISGLTDGIKADLDIATPELPEPAFTLQSQMTNLLNNADNPGALITQMDEIRDKFGDKINVDEMFDEFGLDSTELKKLNDDYKSKLSEATKLQELQNKGAGLKDSVSSDLLALATGDLGAIGKLIGGAADKIFGGSTKADLLDNVCTNIPNLEMDADGNIIEKGPETKVPEEDAVIDDETVDVKADIEPEVIDTSIENIDNLTTDEEEPEAEPFDFGPPIDPAELVKEEFQADYDKLGELQRQANGQRAVNRAASKLGVRVPRHELYFLNALNKLIDLYTKNLNIKYTIKAADDPEAFADTKFKVRNVEFQQKKSEDLRRGKGIIKMSHKEFVHNFTSPPPGADIGKLRKVANEVENLEYLVIRGKPGRGEFTSV